MERSSQPGLQHVGLPTACTLVYSNLTGEALDARDSGAMRNVLDDVARALSSLVPIYTVDGTPGAPRVIPPPELLEGRFGRGAHVFVTRAGAELRQLSVRRADLWSAITILKSSGIGFRRRPLSPGRPGSA